MICLVAGARPNFPKIAPLFKEIIKRRARPIFCYTKQHTDYLMSRVFIEKLGLPEPDFHGYKFGKANLVVVVGDVDSSLTAAITAKAKGIKIAHVEAGLRSRDKRMPEERNRIIIDMISDYLFVTEQQGIKNLREECINGEIHLVGNTMIDNLSQHFRMHIVLTLHRPSNVDDPVELKKILEEIDSIGIKVVFPVHPRVTIPGKYKNIEFIEPLEYYAFINCMCRSVLVLTDSGGVQEEAVYLGKKCITLRTSTERPITLLYGNQLHYQHYGLSLKVKDMLDIPSWDGKASERIIDVLEEYL